MSRHTIVLVQPTNNKGAHPNNTILTLPLASADAATARVYVCLCLSRGLWGLASRTFLDFETIPKAMDAICAMFEKRLRVCEPATTQRNATQRNATQPTLTRIPTTQRRFCCQPLYLPH